MQSLDLNLATRPFKNNTLLWGGYLGAILVLVAFSVWNVITWEDHKQRLADLQITLGSIDDKMRDLENRDVRARHGIEAYDLEVLDVQASKANEVIDWKAFSWTRLFNLLERIQPNDIRMTSIRPIFRGRQMGDPAGTRLALEERSIPVAVEGVAKGFADLLQLQDVLQSDAHIRRVSPDRLHKTDRGEIVFQLRFLYFPNAPAAVEAVEETPAGAEEQGETAPEPEVADEDALPAPAATEPALAERDAVAAEALAAAAAAPPEEPVAEEAAEEEQPRAKAPARRPFVRKGNPTRQRGGRR